MAQKTYDIGIRGRTYPLRKELKELGLWWDRSTYKWVGLTVEYERMTQIRRFAWKVGLHLNVRETNMKMGRYISLLRHGQQTLKAYAAINAFHGSGS
ncbi:MAG: hypothetical protein BME93_03875 [Methanosarcinales archaeon Met12]|nr:MAG: hypothetical protein BME93_03875 [Methanosarcinales archaeon Met12]